MDKYENTTNNLLQAIAIFASLRLELSDTHKISLANTQASPDLFLQASLIAPYHV